MTYIQAYFSDESQSAITAVGVTWDGDAPESLQAIDWFSAPTHGAVVLDDARYATFWQSLPDFMRSNLPAPGHDVA